MPSFTHIQSPEDLNSLPEKDRLRVQRVMGMVKAILLYTDQPMTGLWDSLIEAGNDPDNPLGVAPNAAAEASSALISYHLSSAVRMAVLHTGARLGMGDDLDTMEKYLEGPTNKLGKTISQAMEEFQQDADKIAASRN